MNDSSILLDDKFKPLLRSHEVDDLNAFAESVYGIWKDYALAYANAGWTNFANANDGQPAIAIEWGLGRPITDAMTKDIADFYVDALADAMVSGKPWEHKYECSSAKQYRVFKQTVYPLRQEGFLITNALLVDKPHDAGIEPGDNLAEADYRSEHDILTQCAYCRKVRNLKVENRWDWVGKWVRQCPPNTSHGICPPCFGHYFPLDDDE